MNYINALNTHLKTFATFSVDQNMDQSIGSNVGTLVGTAAVNAGKLEVLNDTAGWLLWDGVGNYVDPNVGTILFKWTPNFNDAPTYACQIYLELEAEGNQNNSLGLVIADIGSGGTMSINSSDSAGSPICSTSLGAYSFVLGQEYTIQIDYNFTTGSTKVFIDGVQHGTTDTGTGVRSTAIGSIRLGVGWDIISNSPCNCSWDDYAKFDTVQANLYPYTLGYEFPLPIPANLPTKVRVYGFIYDANAPVSGVAISMKPHSNGFKNPATAGSGIFNSYVSTSFGTTDVNGFFVGDVYLQPTGKFWEIAIGAKSYFTELPDQASVDISTLTLTNM